MGHSKALKLKSAVTGAYCQMMYAHSGRRKPSLFARERERGSERATVCFEFNTRRSRPRPSPDRGRGGSRRLWIWVCSTEAARNRFIAAVCASRGRPSEALSRLSHPRLPAVGLSLALLSFVWGGGVWVGQLPRKSSGHYARAAFPLVCPPTPEK